MWNTTPLQTSAEPRKIEPSAVAETSPDGEAPAPASPFVLEPRWLEEVWSNAQQILGAQDVFLQALKRQRDRMTPL